MFLLLTDLDAVFNGLYWSLYAEQNSRRYGYFNFQTLEPHTARPRKIFFHVFGASRGITSQEMGVIRAASGMMKFTQEASQKLFRNTIVFTIFIIFIILKILQILIVLIIFKIFIISIIFVIIIIFINFIIFLFL